MKKFLVLLLVLLAACSKVDLNREEVEKFKVTIDWNKNIKDVKLEKKGIWKGRTYKVEEGKYKISWKYEELNTTDYEESFFNYHWKYQEVYIDKNIDFTILGKEIKEGA